MAHTHYLLAQDYIKKKNADAAKQELFKALENDPENPDAHHLLGVIFFLEGVHAMNFVERQQCLQGAAAAEQRQQANEQFRQAETHLLRSLQLSQKEKKVQSDTLNYLANVALHFKRYGQAVQYATQALNNVLYSDRHMALGTRGWAHFNAGKLASSGRDLRQSLFHQPRFCVGRYRLARVYYEQKQYEKSIEELKKIAGDKDCAFQDPHHLLGLAYTKARQPEEARIQFDRCVASNPRSCIAQECRRYAKLIGQ